MLYSHLHYHTRLSKTFDEIKKKSPQSHKDVIKVLRSDGHFQLVAAYKTENQ